MALHADVTFAMARLGSEDSCPVRFKMELRQASLSVEVPQTEPVVIDLSSVARDGNPATTAVSKRRSVRTTSAGAGVDASGKVGAGGASGSLGLAAKVSGSGEATEELNSTTKIDSILVSHSADERGIHHWTFKPGLDKVLSGKPWAAAEHPLMKIKDGRSPGNQAIETSIRLELTCLREDIRIYDIVFKEKPLVPSFGFLSANKMIAAEAYIKNRLEEVGLVAPDISDGFARIVLARTSSVEGGW